MSRSSDLAAVFRGLESITRALIEFQSQEFGRSWTNSSLKSASETLWKNVGVAVNDAQATKEHVQQGLQDRLSTISTWTAVAMNTMKSQTSSMVGKPEQQPLQPEDDSSIPPVPSPLNQNETLQSETVSNSSLQAKSSHSKADNLDGHKKPDLSTLAYELQKGIKTDSSSSPSIMAEFSTTRTKPKLTHLKVKQELSGTSKERRVPASRIGRLLNYGGLAAGLGIGALAEVTRRSLGLKPEAVGDAILDSNPFLTEANAERIVSTLCRVRGAALKLGQMLSIQDNSFINPELQKIFERVRQSADFMPSWQMLKVIKRELGSDWKKKVASFDERPFAAASIGQVHRATLVDGREVAMKIQYPGVAQSIDSDINNLLAVMKVWKLLPEGLYIDNAMIVAKKELSWEVDYVREAECGHRFRNLLKNDPVFIVPEVIEELSTSQLLTSDYIEGISLDACRDLDQETRNMLGENILRLCLKELFEFNFMQTDPNWANFFYVPQTNQIALLDFGASREFSKSFVDKYIRVIKGASCNDREGVLTYSRDLGFLTGYETKIMEDAHVDTVMILGEAFATEGLFDFNTQSATERIQRLIPIMLKYRLSAPPEESYSLHRKMSGSFLLCTKLRSQINCKQLFDQIWESYKFQ